MNITAYFLSITGLFAWIGAVKFAREDLKHIKKMKAGAEKSWSSEVRRLRIGLSLFLLVLSSAVYIPPAAPVKAAEGVPKWMVTGALFAIGISALMFTVAEYLLSKKK